MMARSKVSCRKPSFTRDISLSWQYSRALSRTIRSSDVSSLSSRSGSSQVKGLRSSFDEGFAVLCSAADMFDLVFRISGFEEVEDGLLVDLVADRRHVVAIGHGDGAAVGEGLRQSIGATGQV